MLVFRAEGHQELAIRCKLSDGMVEVVHAINRIVWSYGDTVRIREYPTAPSSQHVSLGIKNKSSGVCPG